MAERTRASFHGLRGKADLVLLAGDLTTCGDPDEARVLADACQDLDIPVVAVLGNHDWHLDRADEISGVLAEAGVTVLDRASTIVETGGGRGGGVGGRGFVWGLPRGPRPAPRRP